MNNFAPEARMCGGLIAVRAGAGTWAGAYGNLEFFAAFWVKPKSRKKRDASLPDAKRGIFAGFLPSDTFLTECGQPPQSRQVRPSADTSTSSA
jgi:hypothetical protein